MSNFFGVFFTILAVASGIGFFGSLISLVVIEESEERQKIISSMVLLAILAASFAGGAGALNA